MILLSILTILKTLLFVNMTNIEWNTVPIFFITLFIAIFILSIINIWDFKYKNILLTGFYTLFSFIMLIDVIYYSYFNALPSIKMFSQVGQLQAVSESVKSLFTLKNLLFIIDFPVVMLYLFKFKDRESDIGFGIYKRKSKKKFLIPIISLLITILLFGSLMVKGEANSIKLQEFFSFHFTDIVNSFSDKNYAENVSSEFDEEDLLEFRERARLKDGKYTGIGKDKNLIVIQVEALQSFVVDLIYEGQEVTPNLNRLIHDKSSLYYDEYYQLLGRGNTSDAEFVTNNSLHPSMETPTYTQYQDNTFYGLPWLLRDNGYTSWAFHGYEKDFWNRANAYENQGFQRFISQEDFHFEESIGLGITDRDFFNQSVDYLKELEGEGNPYYAFMVTLTSHNPYDMPEKYHTLKLKDKHKDTLLGNYLQSIHYFDETLGEFIEELKEEGIYEESVIALYGDHFAIQNTTKEIHDMMEDFLGHKYQYNDIMNIPLVIHIPDEELGETISKVGSQIDFFPTIMNIMGYDNEKGLVFGRDLNNYEGYTNVSPQTIMRKGSFVDKDTIFEISRTEIFDHSRAWDRNTGEEVDINEYRDIYDKAIEEINKSNFILKNDLMKILLEKGELDLENIVDREHKDRKIILKIKENKNILQELDNGYKKGSKTFALDINSDTNLDELADWIKEHEDVRILFKCTDDKKIELFKSLKYKYNKLTTDSIVEINDFDEHYFITSYGYENLLLNIKDKDYTEKEILDFLKVHKLFGVVLDRDRIGADLSKEINSLGIDVYIESKKTLSLIQ